MARSYFRSACFISDKALEDNLFLLFQAGLEHPNGMGVVLALQELWKAELPQHPDLGEKAFVWSNPALTGPASWRQGAVETT